MPSSNQAPYVPVCLFIGTNKKNIDRERIIAKSFQGVGHNTAWISATDSQTLRLQTLSD